MPEIHDNFCFEELASDFQRVVEIAAVESAKHRGHGDKVKADEAATQAMRKRMHKIRMRGTIRVGEGDLDGCDDKSMLQRGEKVGLGWHSPHNQYCYPEVDIAVDPLEGTELCAEGGANSMCVAAFTEKGGIIDAPDLYMDKLVVGPAAKGKVDINQPIGFNLEQIAKSLNRKVSSLSVMVLKRTRHQKLIEDIRKAGASVILLPHGDLTGAILCALRGSNIAATVGIGGGPEGFLAAAAMKILGGEIQGRFQTREMLEDPEDQEVIPDNVVEQLHSLGIKNPTGVLNVDDMVTGDKVVFAYAAVTDSGLLNGVHVFDSDDPTSHGHVVESKLMMKLGNETFVRESKNTCVINMPEHIFSV